MVVVDHADARVALLVGHRPGEERIRARALGKMLEPARAFRLGLCGREIPIAHGLRVAETGVKSREIARIEAPQAQALDREDGMSLILIGLAHIQLLLQRPSLALHRSPCWRPERCKPGQWPRLKHCRSGYPRRTR